MTPIQKLMKKIGELYPAKVAARFGATLIKMCAAQFSVGMSTRYEVQCVGSDGHVKWTDCFNNLVVDTGLNNLLDNYLKGSAYTASFFVGLTDGTPTVAAGDTMASHVGWVEVTAYDEANRQALTLGTVASQSVSNTASKAAFTINANGTAIGGAFVSTDNTRGGTAGVLYGAGAFTGGDKSADDGDTLNVTVTLTAAAA